MKTSELTGPALDWAVAKCEGRDIYFDEAGEGPWFRDASQVESVCTDYGGWELCGPIIEREWLCVDRLLDGRWLAAKRTDTGDSMLFAQTGPTPLVAAMRCYVASKMGDEIDIPEELK